MIYAGDVETFGTWAALRQPSTLMRIHAPSTSPQRPSRGSKGVGPYDVRIGRLKGANYIAAKVFSLNLI